MWVLCEPDLLLMAVWIDVCMYAHLNVVSIKDENVSCVLYSKPYYSSVCKISTLCFNCCELIITKKTNTFFLWNSMLWPIHHTMNHSQLNQSLVLRKQMGALFIFKIHTDFNLSDNHLGWLGLGVSWRLWPALRLSFSRRMRPWVLPQSNSTWQISEMDTGRGLKENKWTGNEMTVKMKARYVLSVQTCPVMIIIKYYYWLAWADWRKVM